MDDSYIYAIVALLPLAAVMLTVQVNPYNALVIRGILGAIAALVYAVLGAADVALTEALVGTMLGNHALRGGGAFIAGDADWCPQR